MTGAKGGAAATTKDAGGGKKGGKKGTGKGAANPGGKFRLKTPFLPNQVNIRALDNGFIHGTNRGIVRFSTYGAQTSRPLQKNETRKFMDIDAAQQVFPDADCEGVERCYRSVIITQNGDGEMVTRLEVEGQWTNARSSLFSCLDMGNVGWPGRFWLYMHPVHQLLGFFIPDPCHTEHKQASHALSDAALSWLKVDGLYAAHALTGPHRENSNADTLRESRDRLCNSIGIDDDL